MGGKKNKICNVCNKPWDIALKVTYTGDGTAVCVHDDIGKTGKKSEIQIRRNESQEMNVMALQQAKEYGAANPQEKMTTVNYPSKGQFGGPAQIPEKTIEKI